MNDESTGRYAVPFNRPFLVGRELDYIRDATERGWISGGGYYTKACQTLLERELGAPGVLLTTSGTHALEMTALLLDLQPGDEVILPSFTYVSTANAFALRGAIPVFCDIRPDTLNIDEQRIESLITPRTKAIVAVHYAGTGCDMETILAIAAQHGLKVIEDNAHGLFGRYRNQSLGTFGTCAALSFHETKNLSCGEGGALLINDVQLIEKALTILEKGTDRDRYFRGSVKEYSWVSLGSSYQPSEMLTAFLYAQLEERVWIQRKRQQIWETYHTRLRDCAIENSVVQPVIPADCSSSYHLYYLIMPSHAARQALIAHLQERGILGVFHYSPLHLSEMGLRLGAGSANCPVTEDVSQRIIRLPFFNGMTEADQTKVIDAVMEFFATAAGSQQE